MSRRRPWIAHQPTAAVLGVALVVSGFLVVYDAYEGRGLKSPWFFGPFKPW